jgi:hypothetical protein
MDKFQRNYIMQVEGADGKIYSFNYPMTLQFTIDRRALATANNGTFRLYNLSSDTRKVIYKDAFDLEGTKRLVTLTAGYGDNLSQIFYGNIKEAKSYREEGSVDFITEIDAFDWSFAMITSSSNWTMGSPQYSLPLKRSTVINRLVDDLVTTGVSKGVINNYGFDSGDLGHARAYIASDKTWKLLTEETNGHCFIDNGTVHCLLDEDAIEGDIPVINSSTGLLSTPKKSGFILKIDILFEPAIRVGQQIELVSESESLYNGQYKVIGIQHNGIISGAVNGKCRTSLLLNAGQFELNILTGGVTRTPVALGL